MQRIFFDGDGEYIRLECCCCKIIVIMIIVLTSSPIATRPDRVRRCRACRTRYARASIFMYSGR